jgi:putative ABC transport system substrate-binding protein
METKRVRRKRFLSLWSRAVVLAFSTLCVGVSLVGAQPRHYRVAVLTPGLSYTPVLEGLQEGLAQLGYVAGKNVTFLVEDTHGTVPDLAQRATGLAAAGPDVLVTVTTSYAKAAQQATTSVPIVFTWVGDPLHSGLIASYASSQNNLTGISNNDSNRAGKRLELLQEIAPAVKRVLTVVAAQDHNAQINFQRLDETAKKLGIQVVRHDVTTREEIESMLRELPSGSVDAIFHIPSALAVTQIELFIEKAKQEKIPLIVNEDSMVDKGALVSYGSNFRLIGMQAAKPVVKILKGTQPAEMPTQTQEEMMLALNLTTAKVIDLKLPRNVLERADRLVE